MARASTRIRRVKPRKLPGAKPKAPTPKPRPDALANNRLVRYMEEYFEWMQVTGYSEQTVRTRRQSLRKFIGWCDERGLDDPRAITLPILERYQRHLFYYRKSDGAPLSLGMQSQYLTPLKTWFKWLTRARHILANPAGEIDIPHPPKRLPRAVPSVQEVESVLSQAEVDTPQGLRDRAMLEVLYATGLRRKELPAVALYDVDLRRGVMRVRQGKGGHERMVPLGERAAAWVDKYLAQARPQLASGASGLSVSMGLSPGEDARQALFLTDYGEPMQPYYVADKVKRYLRLAGLEQPGSTHLLRHACATHMLDGGADIRFIQEMLGHANLQTTEIYTHVSIGKLIAVHAATHPSRLQREPQGDLQRQAGSANPVSGPSLDEAREQAKQALLHAMDMESDADADDALGGVDVDA
jgi:integrase/recombinase XerD